MVNGLFSCCGLGGKPTEPSDDDEYESTYGPKTNYASGPQKNDKVRLEMQELINKNHVMVFCEDGSTNSKKTKEFLDSLKISYKTKNIDAEWEASLKAVSGANASPSVFVDSNFVGDHDDLTKLHEKGKLLSSIEAASSRKHQYDLIVIGGGSGGLAASKRAAELGKKVAVLDYVEPTPKGAVWGLGGTCVNVGCIPKKLMHHAAILGHGIHDAQKFGWEIPTNNLKLQWLKMKKAVQGHIGNLNDAYVVQLREKRVNYVNGFGKFEDKHTIRATDSMNNSTTMTAEKFIIAVGERPRYPDVPGAKELCITSDDLFSLSYPPGKTLVIGASYVALECAGFLKGIGFDVTLMVRSIFLRGFDQQMAKKIEKYYRDVEKIEILQGCIPLKFEKASGKGSSIRVFAQYVENEKEFNKDFETVVLAIGRESATSKIGLKSVGIHPGKNGKIAVNDVEQTSVPNIYCIGDNAEGKPELTPVAIQAGKLLAERLYGGASEKCDYINVPTTVFTSIEYSSCGYSEEAANEKFGKDNIEVYHANFIPLEWTVPKKDPNLCYAKVICDKNHHEKVIGIHYLGPNAGEVMQGFAVAMKSGVSKKLLDSTIGIHPTTAENITTLSVTKSSGAGVEATGC